MLRTTDMTALSAGPSLVRAERFAPNRAGLAGECPAETVQVVQLVWEGGVTGPDGARLGAPQRNGISITLADGRRVIPLALADDDPDNCVLACLADATPAEKAEIEAK